MHTDGQLVYSKQLKIGVSLLFFIFAMIIGTKMGFLPEDKHGAITFFSPPLALLALAFFAAGLRDLYQSYRWKKLHENPQSLVRLPTLQKTSEAPEKNKRRRLLKGLLPVGLILPFFLIFTFIPVNKHLGAKQLGGIVSIKVLLTLMLFVAVLNAARVIRDLKHF